jgi:hypothetical protein
MLAIVIFKLEIGHNFKKLSKYQSPDKKCHSYKATKNQKSKQ